MASAPVRKVYIAGDQKFDAVNLGDAKNPDVVTIPEFTRRAIKTLRTGSYKGIHVVFSGYNEALKALWPDADPRVVTTQLVTDGICEMHGARGGAMLYLAGEMPESVNNGDRSKATLAKIKAGK